MTGVGAAPVWLRENDERGRLMLSTIQGRMLMIFAAFAVLLGGLVATTRSVLSTQSDDGLLVNLAGRQRMLSQKMTKECLQLTTAQVAGRTAKASEYRDAMRSTMQIFETTLFSLRDGGPAPINLDMTRMRQVPPAATAPIRGQFDDVVKHWTPLKSHLNALMTTEVPSPEHIDGVIQSNGPLLASISVAVDMMQLESERKVSVLGIIQLVSLVLGIALVVVGLVVARSTIARPIMELSAAARAMSTGNLNVEFRGKGTAEVQELSDSFDRMRASMLAALDDGVISAAGVDDDL